MSSTRLAKRSTEPRRRGFKGARILVLGVAYKKNVDDVRESPALSLIELIESRGAIVDFYDPFVPQLPPMREHATLHGKCGVSWDKVLDGSYRAALIVTDHDDIDYAALVDAIPLVVDTRNACHRAGVHRTHIVKA